MLSDALIFSMSIFPHFGTAGFYAISAASQICAHSEQFKRSIVLDRHSTNRALRMQEISLEAGEFIMPLWKKVSVDHKADRSEITKADRDAGKLLRERIGERFPDHAILRQEFGGKQKRDAEHL